MYLLGCAGSWLQHVGSSVFTVARGIFSCSKQTLGCRMWYPVSDQGSKLGYLHWKHRILATELPGESHFFL